MGKYNLGKTSVSLSERINTNDFYLNDKKADKYIQDIDNQLDVLRKSLLNIQKLLNQSVNIGLVNGNRATTFKSWARKAKSQSTQADKLRVRLLDGYRDDVEQYPIHLLDLRIAILEKKINDMANKK